MMWYGRIVKQAKWGHEDTLEGEMMQDFFREVCRDVNEMRKDASHGGPEGVLPRWQGELRRKMLMLPPENRVRHMSMYELRELRGQIEEIKKTKSRYSQRRFTDIFNGF